MRILFRSLTAILVLVVTVSAAPLGVQVLPSHLTIDGQNNASATIVISNDSDRSVPIFLTADDFELAPGEPVPARIAFGPAGTTAANSPSFELVDLKAKTDVRVRTDITNFSQAGIATAVLRNRGEKIGELIAVKDQFPFNVKPLGSKDDAPLLLRFCDIAPAYIVLKNDDALTYSLDWKLEATSLPPQGSRIPRLAGQGTSVLRFNNDVGWIPSWNSLSTILRPVDTDGMLTITATSRDQKLRWKERTFPVTVRRSYWSDYGYQWVTFVILSLLLTLGGIASLLLNNWIPNRLKRVTVREAIEAVSPKIRVLSSNIMSALRVGIRVEKQRLLQRLKSRSAISPDFAMLAAECEAGAQRLGREVDLIDRIDEILRSIESNWPAAGVHGPTLLRRACTLLHEAQLKLARPELTDAIVADAEAIINQAEGTITSSQVLDTAMTADVAGRVAGLRRELKNLAESAALKEILDKVPLLNDVVQDDRYEKAEALSVDVFCDVDTATTKLELVERFVKVYAAILQSDGETAKKHLARFIEALRRTSFAAYREGVSIVEQVEEISFADDATAEIKAGRVKIRYEPQSPKVNQAVTLCLEFQKRRLNEDAARNTLVCEWHFVHGDEEETSGPFKALYSKIRKAPKNQPTPVRYEWTEEGFRISHYFPTPEAQRVWVRFFDEDGAAIESSPGNTVRIEESIRVSGTKRRAWGERTWIEATRLSIALIGAIFALLGGAQAQIAKVDLVPGLIAVFLLGFSADQIKNIFK